MYTLLLIACTISTATYAQKLDGKIVILENYSDGNVLTLDSLSTGTSNPRVFTWDNEVNSPYQQWKFTATGDEDNTYFITSTYSYNNTANYLEVSHSEVGKNGGKVFLSKPNGGFSSSTGANQVWIVNQSADGYYNFTSAHATGKGAYALELSGNDMGKNGGRMQIWRNQGYKNQKWKLIDIDNTNETNNVLQDTESVEDKDPFSTNLIIPSSFSPNGDGENDFWVIEGIENYPKNTIEIYNSLGFLLYREDSYQNNWDGTYNGRHLPDGNYYYIIGLRDSSGKLMKGHFTLMR